MPEDESFFFAIPEQPGYKRFSQEEAERFLLEKLEQVGPNDEGILQQLAIFYYITNREEVGKKYVDRLISTTDDPEKHAGFYANIGGGLMKHNNHGLAIIFYKQAYSLEPEDTSTWSRINNNLGYCLNEAGQFTEAEGYCRNAIRIDPECHHAYKNLGVALVGQGRYVEAARNFIEATKGDSTFRQSMIRLDQLIDDHPEIIGDIPDLEKVGVGNEEGLRRLAYYYGDIGRHQLAVKYLERLVKNTDDPEKRAGYYLNLGGHMEGVQNFESAIYYYSQAFALEPKDTLAWYLTNNNLGYCLNHFGRFTEAEGYCRSAIRIDPDRTNAYKNLGISLAGQEHYAEAARNYIKATHVNAADPRSLKLLEQLFVEHPELAAEIPDIEAQIQKCQEAVQAVSDNRQKKNEE